MRRFRPLNTMRRFFTIPVETSHLKSKTVQRLSFTFEYVLLLVVSVVISTLGLLMDSSATIIGGMIVSPFIIPVLSLAYGIYDGNIRIMHKSLLMIVVSIAIALATSFLITEISPLKNITDEISIRTTPTLLDLFIALGAGLVGVLALSRHKIADSFAGVAIATSLVPPLSVAGVGLSLEMSQVFYGGMLLFLLNVLAIAFIGTIYLTFQHWLAADKSHISVRVLSIIGVSLLLLVLPLTYQLRNYTYNLTVQDEVRTTIEDTIHTRYQNSRVDHIETSVAKRNNRNVITINAQATIDEGDTISYELQEQIDKKLKKKLQADIKLQLSIRRSVGIISKEQEKQSLATKNFIDTFTKAMRKHHPDVSVSSIVLETPAETSSLTAIIRLTGAPEDTPSKHSLKTIQAESSNSLPEHVEYDITYIPVIKLTAPQQETNKNS